MVLTCMFVLLALPQMLTAQESRDSTIEEGFIQVEVLGVATRDMDVMIDVGELYLPVGEFFDFLNCKLTISNDRQEVRIDLAEGHWFSISQITNKAVRDGDTIDIDPAMIYTTSQEIYLKLPLIERCLGIQTDYSFRDLKLSIADYPILPIANMARTRRGWQVLMGGETTTGMAIETSLDRDLIGAMALDWSYQGSYFTSGLISEQENSGSLRLSMPFLYGILNTSASGRYIATSKQPISLRTNGWTWDFLIPEFSLLSKVTLSSPLKGHYAIALTNTPLTPVRNLGTHDLIGYTQPKWLVEMYDGDKLVAEVIADSNGRYRFSIPVGYGTIHRKTVAIGPHSEKVEEEHELAFNQRILSPGGVDYQANIAIDSLSLTTPFTATLNLQTGLFYWLGLGVGTTLNLASMKSFTTSGSRWYDTLAPTYVANLWLGGKSEASVKFDQKNAEISSTFNTFIGSDIPISVGITGLRPTGHNFASTIGANASASFLIESASLSVGALYVNNETKINSIIAGRVVGISGSVATEFRVPMGNYDRGTSSVATNSAAPNNSDPHKLGFTNTRAMLSFSLISNIFLSAEADYSHVQNSFRRLTFRMNYALSSVLRTDISYSVADYDWKQATVKIGLTMSTDFMQITAGGAKRAEAAYLGSVGLGGGIMLSSAGIQIRQGSLRGESMILLHAFRDRNANGEQDEGEEELGSTEAMLTTDVSSQTSTDGVLRGIPTTQQGIVVIDQYVFADQNLYPSKRYFGVYPMPNSVSSINVPYCEGYDVTGNCEIEHTQGEKKTRSTKGVNGLRITLESTSGVGTFEGEIYNDGTLLVPGVAAGEYRYNLDNNQLAYRQLSLEPDNQGLVTITDTQHIIPLILLLPKSLDSASPPPSVQSR